jgi:hypothetical protein
LSDRSFESFAGQTKEPLWIEESNQRFYAYSHFGQHPEGLLAWFETHMT